MERRRITIILTAVVLALAVFASVSILLGRLNRGADGLPPEPTPTGGTQVVRDWPDQKLRGGLRWQLPPVACCDYEVRFAHAGLVAAKQSRADGADLKVYLRSETELKPLQFTVLAGLNSAQTRLKVSVPQDAAGQLELYWGDLFALPEASPVTDSTPIEVSIDKLLASENATQRIPALPVTSDRLWLLPGYSVNLDTSLNTGTPLATDLVLQLYTAADAEKVVWASNFRLGEGTKKLSLSGDDLLAGKLAYGDYYLGVTERGGAERISALQPLKFSAPLYVTYTIDWEGYDLSEKYMNELVAISKEHKLPLTHFFNPRIYTNPTITAERATALTNWVKQRGNAGDEVSLHLHMHDDLVAAAGLTPKTSPRWGGRTEGHDVLTSAYNEQEFAQILRWAIKAFADHGLSKPLGFRSGGWFLDIENLRALDSLKFVYDSSGSDFKEPYGTNKQSRTWDLQATSKPYQVSRNNQNNSAPPLLSIWEYPNNGADSTNREVGELLNRFNLNFPDKNAPLSEPQVLTYLSHPHWFYIDGPKIRELFKTVSAHTAASDNGPVVYKTGLDAHKAYTELIAP